MTEIVAPKPEFLSLTEAAVLAALGDSANPIAVEISRLVTAYTKNLFLYAGHYTSCGGRADAR
jgi:hypothetical protein